jgi:hypothetical protein
MAAHRAWRQSRDQAMTGTPRHHTTTSGTPNPNASHACRPVCIHQSFHTAELALENDHAESRLAFVMHPRAMHSTYRGSTFGPAERPSRIQWPVGWQHTPVGGHRESQTYRFGWKHVTCSSTPFATNASTDPIHCVHLPVLLALWPPHRPPSCRRRW